MNRPGKDLHKTFLWCSTWTNWNFVFRFGLTNAVKTKAPVQKDEEYFVEYGYINTLDRAPKWYRDLFREYVKQLEDPSEFLHKIKNLDELESNQAELIEQTIKDSKNP